MFGTVALLDAADQALISGFLVNKFRGDVSLLQPGIDMLTSVTGRPTYGVLPWLPELWLDSEDALDIPVRRTPPADLLTVAVVRFPRISNFTDLDALAVEPTNSVFFTDRARPRSATRISSSCPARGRPSPIWSGCGRTAWPTRWRPGSRRAGRCSASAAATRLGAPISDPHGVEGGGEHAGLGLLPVATTFHAEKTLARPAPTAYEIHHGVVTVTGDADGLPGWLPRGNTWGTIWHGLLDDDTARHAFLTEVAELTGKPAPDGTVSFAALREARLDRLADTIDEYADTAALMRLIEQGPTSGAVRPAGCAETV